MLKKIIIKLKKKIIWRVKSIYHLWYIYYLFSIIEKEMYVLVKSDPKFPFVKFGSDFDIFTIKRDNLVKLIVNFYSKKLKYKLTVNNKKSGNVQLDLFYKGIFIYKFDIYNFNYNSGVFNKALIPDVIKSSITKNFFFLSRFHIQVPNITMDSIIRIFELHSFPNKQHHREILKRRSKKIIKKASDEIPKYSILSFKEIIEQLNSG